MDRAVRGRHVSRTQRGDHVKLLFCEKCHTIVVPPPSDFVGAKCKCGRFTVWWEDGQRGVIRVHDIEGPTLAGPAQMNESCWLIGIHNGVFYEPGELNALAVRGMLANTDQSYLFRRVESLVVRFRPGTTGDSAYAPLRAQT